MLEATIKVLGKQDALEKVFSLEEKIFSNERAKYDTELNENELLLKIQAKDATALRTVLNTITKIISVHEKTVEMIKND